MFGVPYVYTQSRILKVRTITVSRNVAEVTHTYDKMHDIYSLHFIFVSKLWNFHYLMPSKIPLMEWKY